MSATRLARLPETARVVVISDLHLGDGTRADAFGKKDDLLRAFFERIAARADALVVAGDGFDVAQAWSLERIFRAHGGVVDDLAALARSIEVHYLAGNHEGSGADLARALPLRYALALEVGDRVRIEHGNAHDPKNLPGDRAAFWSARLHGAIERTIGAPVRIPMRKHYAWSTRLGHWLFYRWGQAVQGLARLDRARGRTARAEHRLRTLDYWGRGEWGDPHGLLGAARAVLAEAAHDVVVFGHSHQAGRVALPGGTYVNTGTWTFDEATYAMITPDGVEVRTFPEGRLVEDEEYRGVLGPHADRSFFDWWERHYCGLLRYDVDAMHRAARGLE